MRHSSPFQRAGLAMAIAALLGGPGTVHAQAAGESTIQIGEQLVGATVRSPHGQDLGRVKDVITDAEGQIRYLVVAHGGWLDADDELFVVPWEQAQVPIAGRILVVDTSRQQVTQAFASERDLIGEKTSPLSNVYRYREQLTGGQREDVVPARGTQPDEGITLSFTALDENGDGIISEKEAGRSIDLERRFSQLDVNNNGQLDRAEYAAFEIEPSGPTTAIAQGAERGGAMGQAGQQRAREPLDFADLDANDNGTVSEKEAQAVPRLAANFEAADRNSDGKLSPWEFDEVAQELAGLQGPETMPPQQAKSSEQQAHYPDPERELRTGFEALDENDDGLIGRQEARVRPALASRFGDFDTDGDGNLGPQEYRPYAEEFLGTAETHMGQRQPMWGEKRIDIPQPGQQPPNPSLQGAQGAAGDGAGQGAPQATGAGGQQDRPGGTPERRQAQMGSEGQATGGQEAADQEPNFANLDTNEDGVLTREEAQASQQLTNRFRDYDRDNDGRLTRAEFVVYAALAPEEGQRTAAFSRLDANNDGVVSQIEAQDGSPRLQERFMDFDSDGDGALDATEFAAFEEELGTAGGGSKGPMDQERGSGGPGFD